MASDKETLHNKGQEEAIQNLDGIYLIDAGAGTGKTSTITRRYINLLSRTEPSGILLLTFTDNAATNMRQKIIQSCDKEMIHKVMEAPISTFHSYCNTLLKQEGLRAPAHLSFDEQLDPQYGIFENEVMEMQTFEIFYDRFRREHGDEFTEIFRVMGQQPRLALSIIKKLCCKGIFPTETGWYLDGETWLRGDEESFTKLVETLNATREGANGRELKSRLATMLRSRYTETEYADAPAVDELIPGKKVNEEYIFKAFREERELLFSFIHTLYRGYINHCLRINRINFDFLIMFAFVLLAEDHALRERTRFPYVMVDEFQDTNEIQFMLVMLLMKQANLFAVGDWKQGIYSFRNATIENITHFSDKMKHYKETLNRDTQRIDYDIKVYPSEFTQSYRSSQHILTFSERALRTPAKRGEELDEEEAMRHVTRLEGEIQYDEHTHIRFLKSRDEKREQMSILSQIQSIISQEGLMIKEGDEMRKARLGDIAVLCRSRHFGLELQRRARQFGIPLVYEGGIELFSTEPALLVLAWLRVIIDPRNTAGWITIMEREGYPFRALQEVADGTPPNELLETRRTFAREKRRIGTLCERILSRYGSISQYGAAIITHLERLFATSAYSLAGLVSYMEEHIRLGSTMTVSQEIGEDAVTVQTIHGAKGLEYPIVFIADCNYRRFPSCVPSNDALFYDDILGLRMRREFAEKNGYEDTFQSWRAAVLTSIVRGDYDEERRLLYVAITRARQYLYLTANRNSSPFFEALHEGFEVEEDPPTEVEPMDEEETSSLSEMHIPSAPSMPYTVTLEQPDVERNAWLIARLLRGSSVQDKRGDTIREILPSETKEVVTAKTWTFTLESCVIRGKIDLAIEKSEHTELYFFADDTPSNQLIASACFHHASVTAEKTVSLYLFDPGTGKKKEITPLSKEEVAQGLREEAGG